MSKKFMNIDNKWITYPEIPVTLDDIKKHYKMEENKNLISDEENVSDVVNPIVPELMEDEATNEELEETVELTEEEKEELERQEYIQFLKDSKKVFKPIKHKGNVTTNQFGTKYKEKRKKKNKATKKSRKANRK